MAELSPGLYETLVSEALQRALDEDPNVDLVHRSNLRSAEAADRIGWYLSQQVRRSLADVPDAERSEAGIRIARALLQELGTHVVLDPMVLPVEEASVLRAITRRNPDGRPRDFDEPLIPLLDTTLLTNAPGEPSMWSQLRSEIDSADAIDLVMAFIRRSGITPLLDQLRAHCDAGRALRVLTTTYTGSTEQSALELLRSIGAQVRISYDLTTTRLHAKAWTFHRESGFSTAYVGSSNLTHSAQATGLEWNVRLSQARNPDVLAKFGAVFNSYWSGGDFVEYDAAEFNAEQARAGGVDTGPKIILSPLELRPFPYQERLLELIDVSREQGHHANLLVAATGTGKTAMAALDYAGLRERLPRARLLFVAHREEILDQSLATFRYALRSPSFGEKWVGGSRPVAFEHVFASIQSLNANDLSALDPSHFDVVVIDEFHHAAADSYERLLNHVKPQELLGLTATPERSDGLPILHWFGDRIAAELRLWDAISQQHLVPFLYYGVHDGVDLTDIPWRRGRGYDEAALTSAYTSSDTWARLVFDQMAAHVDTNTMRCLGFCVSVEHARYMADQFRAMGVEAVAVSGETPWSERQQALEDLSAGRKQCVFSVDLFNEGVDVPAVDVVLMLRPTESPTLFLQQLGRGLRKAKGKEFCVVLDFVGTHRKEFRFDRRYRGLLGGTRRDVERAVEAGFPYLPAGCNMQLDRMASEVVLRSLREAIPTRWPAKVEELRSLRHDRPNIDLAGFLLESGLDLEDVYEGHRSWSDLLESAAAPIAATGPNEAALRRAVGRLLHVNDPERLRSFEELLAREAAPRIDSLTNREQRLLRMLLAQVADRVLTRESSLQDAADLLWLHEQVRDELRQLVVVLDGRIDHRHSGLASHPNVPLQVHGRYSRIEILAAMGIGEAAKVAAWQTGVFEAKGENAELFAFTLDKSGGGFSPTTRYRDYAISRSLIHWESQSVTRADSETGLRYRNHERDGRSIFLFARLSAEDRSFWFLGPGRYRGHVGEKPMAITWELDYPLSGDLYAAFGAAVA